MDAAKDLDKTLSALRARSVKYDGISHISVEDMELVHDQFEHFMNSHPLFNPVQQQDTLKLIAATAEVAAHVNSYESMPPPLRGVPVREAPICGNLPARSPSPGLPPVVPLPPSQNQPNNQSLQINQALPALFPSLLHQNNLPSVAPELPPIKLDDLEAMQRATAAVMGTELLQGTTSESDLVSQIFAMMSTLFSNNNQAQ